MNKRTFAKLTLLAVVLSMLVTACGQAPATAPAAPTQAAAASTQAPAAAPTQAPTKAPEKPTDVELWYSGRVTEAAPPPDDWIAYKTIKDKLNINLKLVMLPSNSSDQVTKVNAAAAANSLPDVFFVSHDALYKLSQQGLVAPVDKLLPLMPERTKTHYSDADRNKLATWDGVMYGLPDPGTLPHIDGLVVRTDWLNKLGLKVPTTLDEFMTVAKAFTDKDPDGNGKNDTYGFCAYIEGVGLVRVGLGTRFDWVFGAYGAPGTWNLADSASFGLNARNPNYMKAVQYVEQMVDAKVIEPDWPTLKKDEFRALWKQGKCGMMHENFAALSTKSNYSDFDKNFPDAQWDVLPPPTGPDGKSANGVEVKDARIYAVSKRAADAGKGPAIAKLLEWMATDGYMLLAFGQEGVNYKLDKDGNVTTEGVDPKSAWTVKEMQPLTQLANMVYVNNPLELKVRYPAYKTQNGRTMDPLAYRNGFDKQPYQESTGASVVTPPSNAADFTRFYSENIIKFVLGQQPMNEKTWADFVAGLDKLGAKDLEANAKKQLQQAGFLK